MIILWIHPVLMLNRTECFAVCFRKTFRNSTQIIVQIIVIMPTRIKRHTGRKPAPGFRNNAKQIISPVHIYLVFPVVNRHVAQKHHGMWFSFQYLIYQIRIMQTFFMETGSKCQFGNSFTVGNKRCFKIRLLHLVLNGKPYFSITCAIWHRQSTHPFHAIHKSFHSVPSLFQSVQCVADR